MADLTDHRPEQQRSQATAAPLFDREAASQHCQLIGLEPQQAHLRALHWNGGGARDLPPGKHSPQLLEELQQQGHRLYVIAGGGRNREAVAAIPAVFAEWDGLILEDVEALLHEAQLQGLPEPTLLLTTWEHGSAHVWWRLDQPCTDIPRWERLMVRLVVALGSDPVCVDPSRLMRLAGSAYIAKAGHSRQGQVLGQARIFHDDPEATTTLEELEAQFQQRPELAEQLKQSSVATYDPPTDAERQQRREKALLPPRPMAQIKAALACIPKRESGLPDGDPWRYPAHRFAAAGLRDALYRLHKRPDLEIDEEAKATAHAEALELMEEHSPSRECGWDVAQVLGSSAWLDEGTFWSRAARAGFALAALPPTPPLDGVPWIPEDAPTNAPPAQPGAKATASLTLEEATARLRQARADGCDGVELETLLQGLAEQSGHHPAALHKILQEIDREAEAEIAGDAAAQELAVVRDYEREIQGFEIAGFLPPRIAAALHTVTHGLPYPGPTLAVSFLAAVSGVLPLGSEILGLEASDYRVPINLYLALVGHTGDRKSQLGRATITRPPAEIQRLYNRAHAEALQAWQLENEGKKKEDRSPKPFLHRLQLQDYTGEALAHRLMEAEKIQRGILIFRDELSGLFRSLDRYRSGGKGGDEEQLLEMYGGEPFASARVEAVERVYDRCHVSIAGTIQPATLRALMGSGDDQGKFARFLFAPLLDRPERIPTRLPDGWSQVVGEARATLAAAIKHAARIDLDSAGNPDVRMPPLPWRLTLTQEAQERFADWDHDLQKQRHSLPKEDPRRGVLGKTSSQGLRVMGLTHILWTGAGEADPGDPLSLAEVERSLAFVELLQRWVMGFHASPAAAEEPQMQQLARRIHQITTRAGGWMTWKEIRDRMNAGEKKGITSAVGNAAMGALVRAGLGELKERDGSPRALRATGSLPP
ncbi:MAG: DUF3987 domain-containing protein [Cyanobium sp. PLM2.Bin73]|nr:MAG: DUF3987 domain-containing protein [Cyanobium sp. PLM2.Bin73]